MLPNTYLGEFLPYVLPHCSSCPDPVVLHMLRRAAIKFCEVSRTWRHTVQQAVSSNSPTIVTPTPSQIHVIETLSFDGRPLTPRVFADSDTEHLTGVVVEGNPSYFTQIDTGTIQIEPFRAGMVRASLILKPRNGRQLSGIMSNPLLDTLDTVPAYLIDQYAETITAGALALILMLPGQPFTDPKKAAMFGSQFMSDANAAKADALIGQQRAPLRTPGNWL